MYVSRKSKSGTHQVQATGIMCLVLALSSLFVADLSNAQSTQRSDEDKVVLKGSTVPDHHAYGTVLNNLVRFRKEYGEEVAVGIVMSELNHNPVSDEAGGFALYENGDPEFLSDEETRQIAARLLAAAKGISSKKKQERKEILCPNDKPYPQGNTAYRAMDLLENKEETIVSSSYNKMLAGFKNKEVQHRLQNWIERMKAGMTVTTRDTEAVFRNSGKDADYLIQEYCASITTEGL